MAHEPIPASLQAWAPQGFPSLSSP